MEKNQKMHVLYIITKLELGGAQKVCLSLLEGIEDKELSTSILSGTQGVLVAQAQKHHSTYLIPQLTREVGLTSIFCEIKAFVLLIKKIRTIKKQYPLLIVHTHSTKAGIMGRWAALFAGVKKRVHTIHGFGFHDHQAKIPWLIIFLLEYVTSLITSHFICVSKADMNIGKKYFPQFTQKCSLIRAAVDTKPFCHPSSKTNFEPPKQFFIFGTIACLKPQKNIIDLLRAFTLIHQQSSEAQKEHLQLHIIGDGIQRPLVEEWIAQHKLEKNIILLGWQQNVAEHMKNWDVFVLSSLWEGLPCAVVEARLSKLPVISYRIAGIPEIIINEKNGFLIEPGNWQSLAQAMKTLIQDQITYKLMQTYNDNLTEFDCTTMIKQHKALYMNL